MNLTDARFWLLLAAGLHERLAYSLPVDPREAARAAGVQLYRLGPASIADEIVLPTRAFYRWSSDQGATGVAIAQALAGCIAAQRGQRVAPALRTAFVEELLVPAWAFERETAATPDVFLWAPAILVERRRQVPAVDRAGV